ncbi:MAG TPA: DUF4345 family protein [Phenylobacterium sp.]
MQRRLLQAAVALAGCVPVAAGTWGVLGGISATGAGGEGHVRYLSGLLLGIGLTFWWTIPQLEARGAVIRALTGIVVIGGLARLAYAVQTQTWTAAVVLPLIMELAVTPALALWRERLFKARAG